jgi:twinkle protein
MSSQCLTKLPHSCGTRDGLQVFDAGDGTVDGYCFSCSTFVRHPFGGEKKVSDLPKPKIKSPEEIKEEIKEIEGYTTVNVPAKRLRQSTLEHYGVKVGLSEEDGKTPRSLCYPYYKGDELIGYKVKVLENKRMWAVGAVRDADFFGWDQALKQGARKIIITEGEDDAISLKRAIEMYSKPEFRDYIAVVSLVSGASSAKDMIFKKRKELYANFDEVILCFDMDDPGIKAAQSVHAIIPEVVVMDIPAKDANQCVIDGKAKALFNATFKASQPKNTRLIFGEDLHEKAKEPPKYGDLTWPWKHIQDETRGIFYGEVIYVGAGVKMGKSEFLNELAAWFIKQHAIKVFLAKPEEVDGDTYTKIMNKMVGKIFDDPDIAFEEEAFDKGGEMSKGKLGIMNGYQHIGWESLKEDILAAVVWGAKAIFIDPITNLTTGMNPTEANSKLEEIAEELSVIAKDNEVSIFVFCHLKAPEGMMGQEARDKNYRNNKFIGLGGCPHEMGGTVYSTQFAGSRAMMRKCHMMIGIEGNKDPELGEEVRFMRHIKILEARRYNSSGIFPVWRNPNTSMYKEA